MANFIISENGKIRDAEDMLLAERVANVKDQKDPWAVIDELVKVWAKRCPDEVEAVKIDVADQREMLVDKQFGRTMGGGDMERRFTLLFPNGLMYLIRTQYKAEELPFDRAFFREFVKRYPAFKIANSV